MHTENTKEGIVEKGCEQISHRSVRGIGHECHLIVMEPEQLLRNGDTIFKA